MHSQFTFYSWQVKTKYSSSTFKWSEPRSISYLFGVIIWVRVVFNRKTVAGDWHFDYLCGSHLQSQVKSRHQMMVFMPLDWSVLSWRDWSSKRESCSDWSVVVLQLFSIHLLFVYQFRLRSCVSCLQFRGSCLPTTVFLKTTLTQTITPLYHN